MEQASQLEQLLPGKVCLTVTVYAEGSEFPGCIQALLKAFW